MTFKVNNENFVKFLQEGGVTPDQAPVEEAPAAPEAGGSPEEQIIAACQQAVETQDCQLAIQVCQAVLQMLGGGAPVEQAPEGQAPVYAKGGRLKYWTKK